MTLLVIHRSSLYTIVSPFIFLFFCLSLSLPSSFVQLPSSLPPPFFLSPPVNVSIMILLAVNFVPFLKQRRQWHPIPVLLPGKSHGRRRLVGCSPWGRYKSDTTEWLHFPFHFHALEKEMAAHSSVLAWRILGTGESGGLPSMGLHIVGHDWSDLAAAATVFWRQVCNKYFSGCPQNARDCFRKKNIFHSKYLDNSSFFVSWHLTRLLSQ